MGRFASRVAVAAVTIAAVACTSDNPAPAEVTAPPPSTSASVPQTAAPAPTTTTPTPPHPASLPSLMAADYDGGDLQVGDVLDETNDYTRHAVTYRSSGLSISGIMNVPNGDGPFPVLILAHGYVEPEEYTSGQGLAREQDFLARRGYVVLHTDYRNHASSDPDPDAELNLRLGYAEDVINAVHAVRRSPMPYLDKERVGLLGRSMGGGVVYNALVAAPGLVDAAVVYAPVSSKTADNFNRWQRDSAVGDAILTEYGEPAHNPAFWSDASPRQFFNRITEPVLIHHGTADDTCPIKWSRTTVEALTSAGVNAELVVYDGEAHTFNAQWQTSIERTERFFAEHLNG